ncbi:hypothetical protein ACJVC5_12735 [Peredibacter sp. HCB2-198]|uniref:hypothetical protein n=1 Tax=Peredibacter sp. HCB2-198 TaxID=3383025 RepID=UPI0038B53655
MKDNRCFVCKYHQEQTESSTHDQIFDGKGNTKTLPLCYNHSVELYKTGQKNFLQKHRTIFLGNFGFEGDLDLMNYFQTEPKYRAWT